MRKKRNKNKKETLKDLIDSVGGIKEASIILDTPYRTIQAWVDVGSNGRRTPGIAIKCLTYYLEKNNGI